PLERGQRERRFSSRLRKELDCQIELLFFVTVADTPHGFANKNRAQRRSFRAVVGKPAQRRCWIGSKHWFASHPNHEREQWIFSVGRGANEPRQNAGGFAAR